MMDVLGLTVITAI